MSYTPQDFGPGKSGPQMQWLNNTLALHGHPIRLWGDTLRDRVAEFQRAQGWSGAGADGLIGPKTLEKLRNFPQPAPVGKIDRTNWKITLPDGTEVVQPEFDKFSDSPWFWENDLGQLVFRANCGGSSTPNSTYARSELREMVNRGLSKASWHNKSGIHTLTGRLAITHLANGKPHAVCAQIHDNIDDVCMVRLEDTQLFVESPYYDNLILDPSYELGSFFDLKIEATKAGILVVYNDVEKLLKGVVRTECYFKAGIYNQSRVKNKAPWPNDKPEDYAESVWDSLLAQHAA